MTQIARVALAARVFTLAAIAATAVLLGGDAPRGVVMVAIVAMLIQLLAGTRQVPEEWVVVVEGAVVAALSVVVPSATDGILPYLTVPVLIGGLAGRYWGLVRVACTEAVVLVVGLSLYPTHLSRELAARELVWIITGVGLGLLGAAIHRLLAESVTETSYRNALELIRQLRQLSGRLSDGLDVVSIADGLITEAGTRLRLRSAGLFTVSRTGTVTPLRYAATTRPEELESATAGVPEAWSTGQPAHQGTSVVVPLTRAGHVVAVLVAECVHPPVAADVAALDQALSAETIKLYAALLFADVRDRATREERQRLAREVHDGVAQDVASLGYLLDAVVPADPAQAEALSSLRREVSRVVAELRHSVYGLRTDTGMGRGLGEGLSALTRHIGARTTMTVHLTLDEGPTRLRPSVEAELLRIAQEAMNNARKHSGAANLWISCRVYAPGAEIVVRDDGNGLGVADPDSYGLQIMRERAAAIGAELEVSTPPGLSSGTQILVRLPTR